MLPRYQMTYAIHRRQRKWVRLSGYKVDRQARGTKRAFMTEITHFVALAFDLVDGGLVAGEAVDCASPAVAIQTALGAVENPGACRRRRVQPHQRCRKGQIQLQARAAPVWTGAGRVHERKR